MTDIVKLDGTLLRIKPQDIDGDGNTGGVEEIEKHDFGTTEIVQPTELGETLKEMNKDEVEDNRKMSSIDLKANLRPIEISNLLCWDALVSMGFLPFGALDISRQKKRLSVSEGAMGRKQSVEVVVGKREQDAKTGIFGKMQNAFQPKQP